LLVAPEAGEERRHSALKAAAAEFIWEQPQGEDTHLGENNTGLSRGQLQRIAIARALLMDRKILLLDECTSALDARTEERVLRNLRSLCPNALLVTHRPQPLEELGVSRLEMGE
jgi:ATP-binding cassette subfamily B protein